MNHTVLRGIFETHPKMDALDAALLKRAYAKSNATVTRYAFC